MEQTNEISRRSFVGGALAAASLSLFASSLAAPQAFADPASEKQAEADAAYELLLAKQAELDRASNTYHRAVEAQEEAQALMEEARKRIEGESATIAECQTQLAIRAHDMYRAGPGSFLDVLLGSRSFDEFATNWDILNTLNASDAALVKRSKESRQAMANAKATYAIQRETASHEAAAAKAVHDQAMATVSEIEAVYKSLSAEVVLLLHEREVQDVTVVDEGLIAQLIDQGVAATTAWAESQGVKVSDGASADASATAVQAETAAGASAGEKTQTASATQAQEQSSPSSSAQTDSASSAQQAGPASQPETSSTTQQSEAATQPAGPAVTVNTDTSTQAVPSAGTQTTSNQTSSTTGSSGLGSLVVNNSLQYLGYDYVWGGKSPASGGFDCSGFVGYVYEQSGSYAPSWTGSLINYGEETTDPQPGDICVIHEESGDMRQHTGIYYGDGQMIHASTYGTGVIISPVQEGMTYRHVE